MVILLNLLLFQSSAKSCSVNLSGQSEGKPVDFRMEFAVPTQSEINESAPLHRLAAKTQIKILETEESEVANDGQWLNLLKAFDALNEV